jgi:hypothetical protein
MKRRVLTVLAGVAAVVFAAWLLAGAFGKSDAERAQEEVCDARAGIRTEVDKLAGLTPTTVTVDAVRGSLESIRADLDAIAAARDDLSRDRRADLSAANDAFAAEVRDIAQNVLASASLAEARTQLTTATEELVASYRATADTFDCG